MSGLFKVPCLALGLWAWLAAAPQWAVAAETLSSLRSILDQQADAAGRTIVYDPRVVDQLHLSVPQDLRAADRAVLLAAYGLWLEPRGSVWLIQPLQKPAAEDMPFADLPDLDEIFVTATGQPVYGMNLPRSVQAFSQPEIAQARLYDLDAYLRQTANAAVSFSGRRISSNISLRGVTNNGGYDQAIAFMVDGLTLSRGNVNPILHDVERIEVLRGAQGALVGRNAIGGAISILHTPPQPEFEGRVSLEYGRFDTAAVDSMVNVPVTDNLFLRIAGYYDRSDGYIRQIIDGRGIADCFDGCSEEVSELVEGSARNGYENLSLRTSIRWQPNEDWTLDLWGGYAELQEGLLSGVQSGIPNTLWDVVLPTPVIGRQFGAGADAPINYPGNLRLRLTRVDEYSELKSWHAGSAVDWTGDLGTFTLRLGVSGEDREELQDADGLIDDLALEQQQRRLRIESAELLWRSPPRRLEFRAGAYIVRDRIRDRSTITFDYVSIVPVIDPPPGEEDDDEPFLPPDGTPVPPADDNQPLPPGEDDGDGPPSGTPVPPADDNQPLPPGEDEGDGPPDGDGALPPEEDLSPDEGMPPPDDEDLLPDDGDMSPGDSEGSPSAGDPPSDDEDAPPSENVLISAEDLAIAQSTVVAVAEASMSDVESTEVRTNVVRLVQQDREFLNYSAFFEAEWHITDRLSVQGGIRYLAEEQDFDGVFSTTGTIGERFFVGQLRQRFDVWLPRGIISWKIGDALLVYGSAAKGFKSGGSNFFGGGFGTAGIGVGYGPEFNWTYEIGLKAWLWNRKLRFALNGFYTDWSDIQIALRPNFFANNGDPLGQLPIITNGGSAQAWGGELDFDWAITRALSVAGSIGYLRTDLSNPGSINAGGPGLLPVGVLPGSPEWTVHLSAQYDFRLGQDWTGYLRAAWDYRSGFVARLEDLGREPVPFGAPARHLVSLQAGVTWKRYSLSLWADNLLNDDGYSGPFLDTALSGVHVDPEPRRFGVRLTVHFD